MQETSSLNWERRTLPLNGTEDLLKQNPITDQAPQEEKVPVNLISDFIISNIEIDKVGIGVNLFFGKNANQFKFKSLLSLDNKIDITPSVDEINFSINSLSIANEIHLKDLVDVISAPTVGYLKYIGSSWTTVDILDVLNVSDDSSTTQVDFLHNTLYFKGYNGVDVVLDNTNTFNISLNANIDNLNDIPTPTISNTMLIWNGTTYEWNNLADVSNGQNLGSGLGIFNGKTSGILGFKSIINANSKLSISDISNTLTFNINSTAIGNEINISDLLDVVGTPINGSTLVYSGSTWNVQDLSGGINIFDSTGNTFNIGYGGNLKLIGGNGIKTQKFSSDTVIFSLSATTANLTDTNFSTLNNGQALIYNSVNQKWENNNIYLNVLGNAGSKQIKNKDSLYIYGVSGITTSISSGGVVAVNLNANFTDLNDINNPTASNQFLKWNGTNYVWVSVVSGEINTVSNVGTGIGLYKGKLGVDLQFKKLAPNNSKVELSYTTDEVLIDVNSVNIGNQISLGDLLGNLTVNKTFNNNNNLLVFSNAKIGINVTNPTFDLEVAGNMSAEKLFANDLVYANNKIRVGQTQPTNASIARMFIDNSTSTIGVYENALQIQYLTTGNGRLTTWNTSDKLMYYSSFEQIGTNILFRSAPKYASYTAAVLAGLPTDALFTDLSDNTIKQIQ